VAAVASQAPMPATPINRCSTLSAVLIGMMLRIESPLPMMKPHTAIAM